MRLYFDLCVYNRPFDYQGQERVALETSAFIFLLDKIEKGYHVLIASDALIYENNKGRLYPIHRDPNLFPVKGWQ